MVAVISGNGLGLGNTSLTQLGQTSGGSPSLGQAANASYVNTATGNLVLQSNDEGLLFDGLPLNVLRTYNSQGQFNDGWSYGFSRNLNSLTGTRDTAGSTITRTDDDGSSVVYTYNATLGVYQSTDQSGAVDTLSWNAGSNSWTFTDAADNESETYNASGQLTALTDTASGASYSFSYNANNQLSQITAGDGDTLIFGYNTANQLISLSIQEVPPGQSNAVTRQLVSYAYDGQGRLSSVTTALGSDTDSTTASYTTTYTYQGTTDLVASVTQSDGTSVSYTYNADNQVATVTTGTGAAAQTLTLSYGTDSTTITDGLGNVTTYTYNAAGQLTEVIAPSVNGISPTTSYTYDSNGNLLTSTDPNGAVTSYSYDANGNLLSVEDGTGNTVGYTYNADDQVTSKTTYTVPAQGEAGQSGYVAPSGAQTTYYVYNANNQLAYTVDPLGNVSENDYSTINGLNELTTTRQYLGATYNTAGNSPGNPPTLSQLQTWVQSSAVQNTLSQSTRVDYTYDLRGQLATQTQYDTVDANGNGVLDAGTVITTATYDAQGQLLQTSSATGTNCSTLETTSYTYDGLGRLISKTDPLGNVTSYLYTDNGSNDTLVITQANGLTTTQVRNSAGQVISSTQTATGQSSRTTSYLYNADGEQIAAIDPAGDVSYTFYNADGEVSGTVDGDGNVTAYAYDADGNVIQSTQYATQVSTAAWMSGGALTGSYPATLPIPASSTSDLTTTTIYNAAGEVVATIDPAGNITTVTYDGDGDVTTTTQYATPLTEAQVAALGAAPTLAALMADVTTSASDRTTVTLYDADSRPIASIDPTGAVTVVSYDALGDVLSTTAYGQPLTAAQITALMGSPNLPTLQALLNPTQQTTYNANHQPVATIAANGDVTVTSYNANGGVTSVTAYANPLSLSQIVALGVAPTLASILAAVTSSPDDATSVTLYDANNNPVATVSASGVVTESTFDAAHNVTSTTVYANTLTAAQVASLDAAPSLGTLQGMVVSSASDQTTYTIYNASEQAVATVSPMGLVTTTSYDAAGNVVATTQYATALSSSQIQNLAADPTQATLTALLTSSADDQTTVTLYDSQERKAAVVNASGQVTLFNYPSTENTVAITLAVALTSAQLEALYQTPTLATLDSEMSPEGATASTSLNIYDSNNNLVATVSSSGVVTTMSYDGNGNLVSTVQYADALTNAQVQSLGTSPTLAALNALVTPSSSDRASVTIYDQDNRVIATVSTTGVVETTTYDANGNVTATVQYATPLTTAQVESLSSSPTLSALENLVTPSLNDSTTITIYDSQNRVIAEVSNTSNGGYLDTTTYDANGNVQVTAQYTNSLTALQLDALSTSPTLSGLLSLVTPSDLGPWNMHLYNSSNQLVSIVSSYYQWQPSTDTYGYVYYATTYSYDSAGHQNSEVQWYTPLTASQVEQLSQSPSVQLVQSMVTPSQLDTVTVTIYDSQGQQVANVGNGYVYTTTYGAASNSVVTVQYGIPLTIAQLESLAQDPTLAQLQSLVTPSAGDDINIVVYNANSQPVAVVADAEVWNSSTDSYNYYGGVTTYTYDGNGNEIATTYYATLLTPQQLMSLGSAPTLSDIQAMLTPSASDTTRLWIFNTNNQAVASVGPQGNVTTTSYDAAGNVTYTRAYATDLTTAQLSALGDNPTLAQLQADLTPSSSDQVTLNIYDSSERKVATVSPAYVYDPSTSSYGYGGVVSTTSYNAAGDVIDTVNYTTPITESQLASLGDAPTLSSLQALLTSSSVTVASSIDIYDADNNLVATVTQGYFYNPSNNTYDYGSYATQYDYGSQGQIGETRFATPLSSAQLDALALNPTFANFQSLVTTSVDDLSSLTITNGQTVTNLFQTEVYDDALEEWVSADQVTSTTYAANGDVLETIQYGQTLTAQQADAVVADPTLAELNSFLSPGSGDWVTLSVPSDDGLQMATVRPVYMGYDPTTGEDEYGGQVTITTYDASGRQIAQTAYANDLTSAQMESLENSPTFSEIQSLVTPSDQDQTYINLYGANGEVVAAVSSTDEYDSQVSSYLEGMQVTTFTYDAAGNQTSSVQYGNLLTDAQMESLAATPTLAELNSLLTPSSSDQRTLTLYNADEQVVATITPDQLAYNAATGEYNYGGDVTINSYDAYGNLAGTITYSTPLTAAQLQALGTSPTLSQLQAMVTPNPDDTVSVTIYNENGQVVASVDDFGDVTTTSYDADGNVVSTTEYSNELTLQQEEALANSPTLATLQSVLVPSSYDQTSLTIYGSNEQVLATVSLQGVVTVMTYDADGNQIASQQYVAGLSRAQVSQLLASPSMATLMADLEFNAAQGVAQTFYNANGQVLATVSDGGNVVVNTYDNAGDLTSTTQYALPLQIWPVALSSFAQLQAMIVPSTGDLTTRTIYNGNGQPVATISSAGDVTLTSYDAQGDAISTTTYTTPLTSGQMASLGTAPTLSAVLSLLAPTSHTIYNVAGQPVVSIDPEGNATYSFYNDAGELAEVVDADGAVTSYSYDADGNLTQTDQYATLVDTLGWLTSTGQLSSNFPASLPTPPATSSDRITTQIYNASGQVVAVIDPAGAVTVDTYDAFGEKTSTTQYATALTSAQMAALGSAPTLAQLDAVLSSSAQDRTTITIYDADGNAVATIDPDGYVTTDSYDADGNIVLQTQYATALTAAQLSQLGDTPSLAALQSDLVSSASDQITRNYYDGTGQLVAQIDADGYLDIIANDAKTSTTVTTRYATALTSAQLASLTGGESVTQLVALLGNNTQNEQTSATYNADGQLVSAAAADGTVTTYTYDVDGRLTSTTITPASGQGDARTTSLQYDTFGNVIASTDADGNTTTYVYNADNQRIESTDPNGNSTWYYYDADGRLLYTVEGQPDIYGDSNVVGNVTAYTYDAFGDVTSTTAYASQLNLSSGADAIDPSAASTSDIASAVASLANVASDPNEVNTVTYTLTGQVASVTDGDGYVTNYSYDAFGDRIEAQQQVSDAGQPVTVADSTTTTYDYDADGRLYQETDGAGSNVARTTSSTYDAFGQVTSTTDGNGNTTFYSYDNLDQQTGSSQVVQGVARDTSTTYDAYGDVLSTTDALGNVTQYQYNIATHTTVETSPDGVVTTTVKDAFGDVLSVTDGEGDTTSYTYDADGNLLSTTDALGNVSTDQYDADGNLILTTDADGDQVSYVYNADGQVLSKFVDPDNLDLETDYTYDGAGREVSIDDPTGVITDFGYDANGNVVSEVQDAGGTGYINQTTTYTYDGNGNVLTETQGAGTDEATTTQYVYDALGRLSQQIVDPTGLNLVTSYAYDADNNLVATTDPDGNTSYTIYNEANEAVYTVTAAGASGASEGAVTQNWYDADGHLVSIRAYASIVSSTSLAALAGSSDTASALSMGVQLAASAATDNDPTTYTVYNADGQPIYQIDPLGNVTETRYNALGQVSETLAYASPVALSGALIASLQAGTAQPSDIQAALQQAGDSDSTARVSYDFYDADGRLVYTVVPNMVDGVLAGVVNQIEYDAAGRVTAKMTYGVPLPLTDLGSDATTASIAQATAQLNTSSTTRTIQYFYNTAGELVAQTDPDGNTSFTFYDADGNVEATVDATGAVVEYVRDDLGRVVQQTSFSTTVDTSGWLVDGVISQYTYPQPDSSPGNDRVVVTTYDALGRVSTVSTYSQITVSNQEIENPDGSWSYITTTTPTDGDTLTYVYDADSRVIQTVDTDISGYSADRVTNYFYDADGNNIGILNADGYLTTYAYDAAGNMVQSIAYASKVGSYEGGGLSSILPASSSNDEVTTNYYDALGNLAGTLDGDGYFTQYTYDLDGQQLSATRYATASDLGTSASFDAIAASLAGTASHQTINTYDSYGDLLTSEDYEGTFTDYTYDNLGNVVQTTVAAGTSDARTTSSTYDAFGDVVSTTDGLGNVTTYTYDLAGNKTSMTDALGNTTWYVYDADNRLAYTIRGVDDGTGIQNAMGEVYEQDYDAFGDVVDTIAYSDRITTGAGFAPTFSSMQAAVNTISGQGPDWDNWISYSYDLEGNVTNKDDGNNNQTNYTYDGFNDLATSSDPDTGGLTSIYTYDDMGNMTSRVDETGVYSTSGGGGSSGDDDFASISTNSMIFGSGGGGEQLVILRTQEWTYDAFGNVATYTDGDGNTTSYSYDDLNQQVAQNLVVSGVDRETQSSYDAYGRVLSTTDAMGAVTTYSYDDADRSVTETAPGGVSTTTTYNREGQKVAVADGDGDTTSYQYDADGNLVETVDPDGGTTINVYDADGNLTQTTDPDGNVTAYTYDAAGRVLTETVDPNGLDLVTSYTYDGRGLMISKTDPNGVITTYSYDGNGNLTYMDQNAGGDADNLDIQTNYRYNDLNELTSTSVSKVVDGYWQYADDNYSYDALGRMTSETTDTGHVQEVQYTYDADSDVTSVTDGNGNVTYYFYNQADQQTYAVAPNGAVTYTTYNADGQATSVTQYATELSQDALSQVAGDDSSALASAIQASPDDRTTYNVYNSADQLVYSIDANGDVTQTVYNNLGQVAQTLAYATPVQLSSSAIADLQAGNAAAVSDVQAALSAAADSSANARVTYTYYDDMGRVSDTFTLATLNGQSGYLAVQTQYDADGNVVATIQYGDLVPASQVGGTSTTATVQAYLSGLADMHVTRTVYDSAGRKVYSINADGDVTQTEYDADGRVIATLQYANAISTPAAWTQADVATAVQVANPNSGTTRETQNVYDAFGNVIETIDGDGNTAYYTYDERGLKLSATDGNGNTTTYGYDQYGNLTSQISPPVAVASYSSTGAYQGTTMESITTVYEYDGDGNLTTEIDGYGTPQARTTQYVYDAVGNLIQTILPDPGVIDAQTGVLATTGTNPTIAIAYNAFGEAVASEDANGNVAYNVYDHDGNLLYAIDGDGYVTGYTYNAYGQQTSVTRYDTGIDTVDQGWSIDQPPSLAQLQGALVTSSADRTITTAYDAQGNKISVTEPVITYTDSYGATAGTNAQGSPVTDYTYDAYGNVTSESVLVQGVPGTGSAVWATTYNYYDAVGNKLMSVDPMGYVTANSYDAFGDVLSTTQFAIAFTADELASLVAGAPTPSDPPAVNTSTTTATTGLDRTTTYTYDNAGNKTSVSVLRSYTNGAGAATVDWDTTTYSYDADNQLTTVTENGSTVTTAYDALGRIISVTGPQVEVLVSNWQALLEANASLTLDSPSLYTLASQVVSYSYDAFGDKLLQTQSSTGSSQSVSTYYQYDNAGHMVAQLTPLDGSGANWASAQAKFYGYDDNGNQVSESYTLTGDDGSTTQVTITNTYDYDNQQTSSVTWRSGIPSPDASTSTTYDAFGEIIASGDGVTNNVVNTYDNAGNKTTSTDPTSGEVHTYGYNLAGQTVTDSVPVAVSAGTGSVETLYTLDLDGRIVAEQAPSTDSATGENAGILSATYDAWGNVLSSTDANGNVTSYTYNERNDVVTETEALVNVVSDTGTGTTETPVVTSSYDIEGNLVSSKDANGNVINNVYNALGQKIESSDGTGVTTYTGYDALGNAVSTQDGNGNISFTNVDALGRAVVTGQFIANGQGGYQLVWQQAYVLDQNGDRIISYDGIGSAYLQSGDTTDAALHASYDGYDSQGRVIWSQDAAQHAASSADDHQNYAGNWTQTPTNANFSDGMTGWTFDPGYSTGNYEYGGQDWPLMFSPGDLANGGSGGATNNDRVPVVPGQSITANGQFEVLSQHGNGEIFIIWYDANGNEISNSNNGPGVTAGNGSGISTVTASAPPGAAYASIAIGCSNYNEGSPGVVCSGVWWSYVPPAGTSVLGSGNTGAVVTLPTGQFTDQADNTNFDEGNTGWDTNGWTIHTASNANSGWEASFNGSGTAVMVNQDRVPVAAGQTISASMQLSLDLAPNGAEAGGAVAINWYDANGDLITTDTGTYINNDRKGAWETSYITSTAPPGAAYASLAVVGTGNGYGAVAVENAQWNYQYIPQAPTGVVQDTYVYNMDGNLVSETTADGDTETWQYNQYGQVTTHTDLSGAVYNYTYDAQTGQEIGESDNWSPTAQGQVAPSYDTAPLTTPNTETLTYYADGQVASETFSDGSSYTYQYDNDGNLISEQDTTVDGNGNAVKTLTQTTYDSHNRISSVTETNEVTGAQMLSETFSYDANGNRREVKATSNGSTQDAWYTYDADNRVLVTDGSLSNGQIVVTSTTGSYENAYDADGNVIQIVTLSGGDIMSQRQSYNAQNELIETQYAVDVTQGATNNGVEETITYDADGHALVTSTYYELGATFEEQTDNGDTGDDGDGGAGTITVDVGGELEGATVDFYDMVGRLAESQTFANSTDWDGTQVAPPTGPLDPDATSYGNLQYQSEVVYQGPDGTSGYDADGDVVAYQYRDSTGLINQYQVTYLKKDSYLQAQTEGVNVAGSENVQPATDAAIYNTRGNEVSLEQHTEDPSGDLADTVHVFAYNGNGEIIESEQGTGATGTSLDLGSDPNAEIANYTYVNGQQLASFNNDGSQLNVLDQVTAFSSNNDSPDSYVVQSGDTLQSIAQAEYGNSNLWYVIAQANDLNSDTSLVLGQRLQIPAVTTHSNTATTFKPYDPTSIIGNTTPNLPQIAPPVLPPDTSGCSVAEIVVLVVTIVVTVLTYGSTSPYLAGELGGSEIAGDAAAGAIAGAAGSLAGQVTGNAEGIENGIDWGAVGEAAIGGAITGGVTGGLQETNTLTVPGAFDSAGNPVLNGWGDALVGAAGYVGNVVGAEITGQPENFSWAGLVATTVGAGIAGEIAQNLPSIGPVTRGLDQAAGQVVGDVVNRELSVALGDQHVPSWAQVGEQALAGLVADPLADYLQPEPPQQGQVSSQQSVQGQQAAQSTLANGVSNNGSSSSSEFVFGANASAGSTSWLDGEGPSNYGLPGLNASLGYGGTAGLLAGSSSAGATPYGATSYAYWSGEEVDSLNTHMTDAQIEAMLNSPANMVADINGAGSSTIPQYTKESNLMYGLPSGTYVQVTDPGTADNGQTLSSAGIVVGQNPDGYSSPDDSVIPKGYTGYLFYTQTQHYAYQGVSNTAATPPQSTTPPPAPNPANAQNLAQVSVTAFTGGTNPPPITPPYVPILNQNNNAQSAPANSGNTQGASAGPAVSVTVKPAQLALPSNGTGIPGGMSTDSVASFLGVTPEAEDAAIKSGHTGVGDALAFAGKVTLYKAWNFFSAGFLERNDARVTAVAMGKLSDGNYVKAAAIDAVASVASVAVGGRVGGLVLGKLGGGVVAHVVSGAAAAGAGDVVMQTGQRTNYVATGGQTGQQSYSGKELVYATAIGAATGGAFKYAEGININVRRGGVFVSTPKGSYRVVSPVYYDGSPYQLNSNLPINVRSPFVPNNIGNTLAGAGGKVPVQMYDVMTYGESKAGAVVGDELTGDHIPSYAAIRQNVETTLGRELTADEAAVLRDNTNTVVVAQDLHAAGRTYFGANTQAQIAEDSLDLTGAAMKDQAVHLENAAGLGYSPTSLQASFGRLNQANQQLLSQLSTEQSIVEFFATHGVY